MDLERVSKVLHLGLVISYASTAEDARTTVLPEGKGSYSGKCHRRTPRQPHDSTSSCDAFSSLVLVCHLKDRANACSKYEKTVAFAITGQVTLAR